MPLRESPQSCNAHIFHWLTTLDLDGKSVLGVPIRGIISSHLPSSRILPGLNCGLASGQGPYSTLMEASGRVGIPERQTRAL